MRSPKVSSLTKAAVAENPAIKAEHGWIGAALAALALVLFGPQALLAKTLRS